MKKQRILFIASLTLSASVAFCDGWSESGLTSAVKIESIAIKDDNSVIVKFLGLNQFYYFSNKPMILSVVLAAKATSANVRAWTSTATGYYGTSDLSPGGIASAHYLGAIQIVN